MKFDFDLLHGNGYIQYTLSLFSNKALSRRKGYSPVGGADGTARLRLLDLQDTIREVCATLTRDLTSEERVAFGISDQEPTCPLQ